MTDDEAGRLGENVGTSPVTDEEAGNVSVDAGAGLGVGREDGAWLLGVGDVVVDSTGAVVVDVADEETPEVSCDTSSDDIYASSSLACSSSACSSLASLAS